MSFLLEHYNYWIVVFLMMVGFYIVITSNNLVKKVVGLNIFQTSVFMMYISFGKIADGTAPIVTEGALNYSNPLPHVLILTAIVVGVATTSVGLSLIIRIKRAYGSVEESDLEQADLENIGWDNEYSRLSREHSSKEVAS